MDSLYDTDILDWSERQAALLRRAAAGERVNVGDLDWPDIIEEIESVGREQLHPVESLLVQAMRAMLKAEAWPNACYVPTDRPRRGCSARRPAADSPHPCDSGSTSPAFMPTRCGRCRIRPVGNCRCLSPRCAQ